MMDVNTAFALPSFDELKVPATVVNPAADRQNTSRTFSIIAQAATAPKLRVAAYCRVSTDMEEQKSSIDIQKQHFTSLAEQNPDWKFMGIYADIVSGTKKEKRPELKRLLGDCASGRVNLVMTKSVSRFARNTTDLLEMVRSLTAAGVDIVFEREHLDTRTMGSEFILTILASLAEDESHSFSDNCRWGLQKRFADGSYRAASAPYGYDLANGSYAINADEAEIVREIFTRVLEGASMNSIAEDLNQRGIPTKRSGQVWKGKAVSGRWSASTIGQMLGCEAYIGDLLLQKSFTDRSFKMRRNNGEYPQYYLENHHPAIIDRETYEAVQALRESRKMAAIPGKAPGIFSGMLVCAHCGAKLQKCVNRVGTIYWICRTHRHKAADCPLESIHDQALREAFEDVMTCLMDDPGIAEKYLERLSQGDGHRGELVKRRDVIEGTLESMGRTMTRMGTADFITEQNRLKTELESIEAELSATSDNRINETEELLRVIKSWGSSFVFEENTFRELIERIEVRSRDEFVFRFRCGLSLDINRKETS